MTVHEDAAAAVKAEAMNAPVTLKLQMTLYCHVEPGGANNQTPPDPQELMRRVLAAVTMGGGQSTAQVALIDS